MTEIKAPDAELVEVGSVNDNQAAVEQIDVTTGHKDRPERQTNPLSHPRLHRELQTMTAMIRCYCRGQHHSPGDLCADCTGLLNYATARLERCHFGAEKPTCANCPIHCYQRERREQIRQVMRYAGPRMLWRHPLLSLGHWLDGLAGAPLAASV